MIANRRGRQDVFRLPPHEMGRTRHGILRRRNFQVLQRPVAGNILAGLEISVDQSHGETSLQGGFVAAEFARYTGKIARSESAVYLGRRRNRGGLGLSILAGVADHEGCNRLRVLPDLLDRAREPLVDGPIQQETGKAELRDHRQQGEEEDHQHHPRPELGARNP